MYIAYIYTYVRTFGIVHARTDPEFWQNDFIFLSRYKIDQNPLHMCLTGYICAHMHAKAFLLATAWPDVQL